MLGSTGEWDRETWQVQRARPRLSQYVTVQNHPRPGSGMTQWVFMGFSDSCFSWFKHDSREFGCRWSMVKHNPSKAFQSVVLSAQIWSRSSCSRVSTSALVGGSAMAMPLGTILAVKMLFAADSLDANPDAFSKSRWFVADFRSSSEMFWSGAHWSHWRSFVSDTLCWMQYGRHNQIHASILDLQMPMPPWFRT